MPRKCRIIAGVTALAVLVYGVAVAAPPQGMRVTGSGIVKTETRTVRNFHGIEVSGAAELTVTQEKSESVTVEAESNLLPFLETRVENGILHLGVRNASITTHKPVRYRVSLREVDLLRASGASSITADAIKTGRLTLGLSGASVLKISRLKSEVLEAELTGASNTSLGGTVEQQHVRLMGASQYNCRKLVTRSTEVSLTGASEAEVYASEAVKINASGASTVRYWGNPREARESTTGASTVVSER